MTLQGRIKALESDGFIAKYTLYALNMIMTATLHLKTIMVILTEIYALS